MDFPEWGFLAFLINILIKKTLKPQYFLVVITISLMNTEKLWKKDAMRLMLAPSYAFTGGRE